jgi:hypothetical protein
LKERGIYGGQRVRHHTAAKLTAVPVMNLPETSSLPYTIPMTALAQIVAATAALDASWAVSVSGDGKVRTWGTGAAPRVVRLTVAIDAGQPVTVALSGKRLRVLWAAGETIRL